MLMADGKKECAPVRYSVFNLTRAFCLLQPQNEITEKFWIRKFSEIISSIYKKKGKKEEPAGGGGIIDTQALDYAM